MPAFVEEDGTGLEDSTSYVSISYADDYLGSDWAPDDTAKESSLQAATEYVDARWGPLLSSAPLVGIQSLEMPRSALLNRYGTAIEGVPNDWKKAVCLYAKSSQDNILYPTTDTTSNSGEVKRKKVVVGPITTETEYQSASSSSEYLSFPLADSFCYQYTTKGLGSSKGNGLIRN